MVDALRKLHHALVFDGKLIDTQPVSPRPAVFVAGEPIGSLDLREWERTIAAVDAEIERALDDGLFALQAEERIIVTDVFDSGSECLGEVREWAGTTVPKALEAKIRAATAPVTVEQEVRMRLLAKPAGAADIARSATQPTRGRTCKSETTHLGSATLHCPRPRRL